MANRRTTIWVSTVIASGALFFWLACLSRDAYPTPALGRWLPIAGGVVAGAISIWLSRGLRPPLENPLKHVAASFVTGAVIAGTLISVTLDTLVRFTSTQPHTETATYSHTSGSRSCSYGIVFVDSVLHGDIHFCGPRWDVPANSNSGVLHIIETSGQFGVVLQQVTVESTSQ
jgi:hypothetical protein